MSSSPTPIQVALETRQAIDFARREAGRLLHEAVRPDHLLLGMIRQGNNTAANLMRQAGVDFSDLQADMELALGPGSLSSIVPDLPLAGDTEQMLLRAQALRRQLRDVTVRNLDLVLLMTSDTASLLSQILKIHGITSRFIFAALLEEYAVLRRATPPEILLLQKIVKDNNMTNEIVQDLVASHATQSIKSLLLAGGHVTELDIAHALAQGSGFEAVDIRNLHPDLELIRRFPHELAHRLGVFPIRYEQQDDTLFLAMSDPTKIATIAEIQDHYGVKVVPMIAPEFSLRRMIAEYFPPPQPSSAE